MLAAEGDHSASEIFSMRHNGCEILHACLYLHFMELYDSPGELQPMITGSKNIQYTDRHGVYRGKAFGILPRLERQLLSDYVGFMVPMEVIERMRRVEGLTVEQWQKRGVEVGEEAWDVLTEWQVDAWRELAQAGYF